LTSTRAVQGKKKNRKLRPSKTSGFRVEHWGGTGGGKFKTKSAGGSTAETVVHEGEGGEIEVGKEISQQASKSKPTCAKSRNYKHAWPLRSKQGARV